ncbi:Methyltransferase-like protein 24 [Podila clonocystis]|nr:Methyltransferase-like protein 24 [Podila clonocystis]
MGVFDDSSWEAEIMSRTNCEVWAFDGSVPDVAGDAKVYPRMHFSKVFIGNEDRVDVDGSIDILKVDIEGYEYETMDALMDSFEGSILLFSQLQIELHLLVKPYMTNDVRGFNKFKK